MISSLGLIEMLLAYASQILAANMTLLSGHSYSDDLQLSSSGLCFSTDMHFFHSKPSVYVLGCFMGSALRHLHPLFSIEILQYAHNLSTHPNFF